MNDPQSQAPIWQQSYFGGGGYITGLLLDPLNPDTLYARCDVAGMFKSEDGAKHWRAINNGMTQRHHHCVQSMAISPCNSQVLLRASGDARDHQIFGTIHKTTDGGETWRSVTEEIAFYGNGLTRPSAEVMVFNPDDPDMVVVGGFKNGVFISRDEGETWRCTGLENERVGCVVFQQSRIYVATVADGGQRGYCWENRRPDAASIARELKKCHDTARGNFGKIYLSRDFGRSWELLSQHEGLGIFALVVDRADPGLLHFASSHGIFRSTDGGRTFTQCVNGLVADDFYNYIGTDPNDPDVLYANINFPPALPTKGRAAGPAKNKNLVSDARDLAPTIMIFKSADKGLTWHTLKDRYTMADLRDYPGYVTHPGLIGSAISRTLVDPRDSKILYTSNYYGVSKSYDGGQTFTGQHFQGLEITCLESVVCDPLHAGRVYATIADHNVAVSEDAGATFKPLGQTHIRTVSICLSRSKPGLLLTGIGRKRVPHDDRAVLWRSEDGGLTGENVHTFMGSKLVESIVEDLLRPGTFYAYVEGMFDDTPESGGIWRSDDWGKTWNKTAPLPCIPSLPSNPPLIDDQLFTCVVYQGKNVFGSSRLLACDPFRQGMLYAGDGPTGVYRSADGGKSWQKIGASLPLGKTRESVLRCLRVDAQRPGHLYAGFIREGLWHSEDSGHTWRKLFPTVGDMNVTDLDVGGVSGQQLTFVCEAMCQTACPASVFVSPDLGESWANITDPTLGAPIWHSVAVDKHTGRIYGATGSNGIYFTDGKTRGSCVDS